MKTQVMVLVGFFWKQILKQRSEGKEFIQEVNSRNMMKKWGNMEKR
jgi:hypothetical protein